MGGSWSRRRRPGGGTEGGADGGDTLSGVPRRVALAVTASYVVLTAAGGVGGDHPLVAAGMPSPRGTAITGPGSASPTAAGSGEAGSPPALTGTCTAFAALMPEDAWARRPPARPWTPGYAPPPRSGPTPPWPGGPRRT
jgi:hypothetical protein